MNNPIFILTGLQGSGKTTFLSNVIIHLKAKGISIGGFIAHGFWKDNIRDSFELEDITTMEKIVLSQTRPIQGWEKFRRFYFNPAGFAFGEKILSEVNLSNVKLIVIDEIGPFELEGNGWRKSIDLLLTETSKPMIWVCRESILKDLISNFNLQSYQIFSVSKDNPKTMAQQIISHFKP